MGRGGVELNAQCRKGGWEKLAIPIREPADTRFEGVGRLGRVLLLSGAASHPKSNRTFDGWLE
jgi:hypothetical protein